MRHLILAISALVLAGCGSVPEQAPAPVTVRVLCPGEALVSEECKPTPEARPKTRIELEDGYDELGVSNTACYAIVAEYTRGIAECVRRRRED